MLLDHQVISLSSSIKEAALAINKNGMGTVFIIDDDQILRGVVTDGDIRRHLISGGKSADHIGLCMNANFRSERVNASRETVLKCLDDRVRSLPLLDEAGKVVKIIERKSYPLEVNKLKRARARAPVRISFAGGGSDLSEHFLADGLSLVLNITIQKYCRASITARDDQIVTISSMDIGSKIEFHLSEVDTLGTSDFDLFISIISIIKPKIGFDVQIESDVAIGTGLGGSSAASAAFLGCLNEISQLNLTAYELAEVCYQSERHYAEISGGWQDQYACVFGGLNLMEFSKDKHIVTPLRIPDNIHDEFEDSLILYDTGHRRNSGDIHRLNSEQYSEEKYQALKDATSLAKAMKDCILLGDLLEFGRLLDQGWQAKKRQSVDISNVHLDNIYSGAKEHGAIGGKLLGAGAGGFFLFLADPKNVPALRTFLDGKGGKTERVLLDKYGLKHWVVKNET